MDLILSPAPRHDACPGDVIYRAGQQIELNGVTRTVTTDATVSPTGRLDVHLYPESVFAPDFEPIKLEDGRPPVGVRYSSLFEKRGSFAEIPATSVSISVECRDA